MVKPGTKTHKPAPRPHARARDVPPLPSFMSQPIMPIDPRIFSPRRHSRVIASLTVAGLASLWVLASSGHLDEWRTHTEKMLSSMINTVMSLMSDLSIGQAFAANPHMNPTGLYPLEIAVNRGPTHARGNTNEGMALPEELRREVLRLHEEIEMIEKQGYNQSYNTDSDMGLAGNGISGESARTLKRGGTGATGNVASSRWREPLTPPRWQEPLRHSPAANKEGVIIPLNQPRQVNFSPPQWERADPMDSFTPAQSYESYDQSDTGNFRIQLGSFRSANSARSGWQKLLSRNNDLLGVFQHSVEPADLGHRGTFYRLRAGSFASIDLAKVVCGELMARNVDCLVTRQ